MSSQLSSPSLDFEAVRQLESSEMLYCAVKKHFYLRLLLS